MALNASNSNSLEQLALKGLIFFPNLPNLFIIPTCVIILLYRRPISVAAFISIYCCISLFAYQFQSFVTERHNKRMYTHPNIHTSHTVGCALGCYENCPQCWLWIVIPASASMVTPKRTQTWTQSTQVIPGHDRHPLIDENLLSTTAGV